MGNEQSNQQEANQYGNDQSQYEGSSQKNEARHNEYSRRAYRDEEEQRERREREENEERTRRQREDEEQRSSQESASGSGWNNPTYEHQYQGGHGSQQNGGYHEHYDYGSNTQPGNRDTWNYQPNVDRERNMWETDPLGRQPNNKPYVDDYSISISQFDKLNEEEPKAKRSPSFDCSIDEFDRLSKE